MALAIFAVAAVGAQQAFAGVAPIIEFNESLTTGTGVATLEYDIDNNSNFQFYNDMGLGPWNLFGFAVEVDEDLSGFEAGLHWNNVEDVDHDGPGRSNWCAGDNECSGAGDVPLIVAADWNAGIVLTTLFGGLSTTDIGTFDQIFTTHDQVAMFFSPNLINMIEAGDSSLSLDFTISGPTALASDMVFLCLTPINDIVNCETGEIYSSAVMVGGSLIPIDTTMVLVAGAQSTSAWMIPVIVAGIGFAIVIARKF